MSDRKETDLRTKFTEAAEIAKLVPEHLQEVAFNRALDALLGDSISKPSDPKGARAARNTTRATPDQAKQANPVTLLCEQLDRTRHPEISADRSALDNALLLLNAARTDCGMEWLQPPQIAAVLKEKFLVRVDRTTVSNALAGAGRLVDRKAEGAGYAYRLMGAGEEHLTNPKKTPVAPRKRARNTERAGSLRNPKSTLVQPLTTERASQTPKEKTSPRTSRQSGRPGPKQILEELISSGYFKEPRTIGDVIDYIAKRRAHTYKATDLSPAFVRLLRTQELERDQNEDNQFIYHEPK